MKTIIRTAAVSALLAIAASPALAAAPPEGKPAKGPDAPGSAEAAKPKLPPPGRYCKGASKQKVEGQKGTPFSACVKAQAKLRKGRAATAREACKAASKKHVKGRKGTPFSTCVKAAKQFIADREELEQQTQAEQETQEPAEQEAAPSPTPEA